MMLCLWLCAFGLACPQNAPAQTRVRQALHGHVPAVLSQLNAVGRLAATNRLQLSIGLPFRNTNDLEALLADICDPASPQYRHYLTRDQFTQRFGPTEADYHAVIAFARTNGLVVKVTYSNRMLVDVEGSAGDVENAFHIALRTYAHPREHRNFYAPDTEPSLDLAVPVLHISGLDNYVIPHPCIHERSQANQTNLATPLAGSGSGPSGNYAGKDFRAAYVPGVTLDGAGQSVGLVEFGGYYATDITNYENTYSLPHVPLVNVLLNGVNLTNNVSAEESLDIEMAVSMAPGLSQVVVYYGSSGDSVLNQIASDNRCKQIGASWGYGSDSDSTMQQDFQEFAAQGQSYFNASGDSDADVGSPFSPSDPPYVISVGGTTLTTSGPGGSWVSEKVWNWGGGTGGSGGVSTTFTIPPWQQGIDLTAAQGSTTQRNIPDVALTADNIWVVYGNGSSGSFGGTSCATPLWAAFTALINEQATANNYPTVGFLNPAVYAFGKTATNYASVFHDITTGNDTSPTSPSKYYAVSGYDLCTGWGTPGGQALINALATPGPTLAAAITWSPPSTISGDSDVCTWGTSLYACDWNNVNQTVNGVSFIGSSSTTSGGVNIALSGVTGGNYTAFTSTSNPYNGLSAACKSILAGGDYSSGTTTILVTLKNLIAGHIYAAQVWAQDARSTGNGRTEAVGGNSGGNTVTLDYNSSNASGGVGQSSIGVFTADGTNDNFTLLGNASTQINALQVRDVTGCAWNSWGGYVDGNWDSSTTNWGNGQPFSFTSVSYHSVNFADTNFYGATVVNNVVSIQSAGVSSGTVNFVNDAVPYTVQNASGAIGITGSTAVSVSGQGTVTFASPNTYTGATTVNGGTFALSGNGSIANSSQLALNGGTFDVTALPGFAAGGGQPIIFGGGALLADNLTLNGTLLTDTAVNPSAPLILATNLIYGMTASAVTISSLPGFASYPVQFPLIQYLASASGTFNLNTLNLPAGYAGYLSNNVANSSVDLVLIAGGGPVVPLVWRGNVNGNWDILTTANWVNGTNTDTAQMYENNSAVLFDDSATNANVALQTAVQPASVTVSNNALNYIFSGGQLAGPMSLTKSGGGQLTLSSANAYTGGTAITGGTLQLNSPTAAGSGTIADGSTLDVNIAGNSLGNPISGTGAVNVLETSGAQTTLAGVWSGFTGSLNIPASSGASKTAITSSGVNLNSAASINISSGGTLYVSGEMIPASINVLGNGNSENYGALRLDNGASAAGPITLDGNTALGSYAGAGMVTGAINDGGHGYSLLLEGSGTMILFNADNYSGGTILKSTSVAVRNGGAFGTGQLTVTNSSTLDGNGNALTNPVNIASGQTLTLNSSVGLNGAISGAGTLASGGGSVTFTLGGMSRNFAGAVTLGAGKGATLAIPASAVFTTSGALNNSSPATITVNGGFSVGSAGITSGGTTILNGSGTFTNAGFGVANNSFVSSSLNQLDTGYFYLGNAAKQSGYFTQEVATVNLSATLADSIRIGYFTNETSAYLLVGGTFNATNLDSVVGWDGNGNFDIAGGTANLKGLRLGDTAANGIHNGNGTVVLSGGTLNLGADGISSGGSGSHTITLGGGKLGALAAWGSSVPMTLTNPAGITVDTTGGNIALSGALSGIGALTKTGPNSLTLSGAVSFSGKTTVSGGTLLVNNVSGTGPGAVNIGSGGTLGGNGTIAGGVTNNLGGTLSPGWAGSGSLTVGGTLTLLSGSTNTFAVNGGTATNNSVVLGAGVTYGGVLNIVPSGSFSTGQAFTLFSGAGAVNAGNFASLAGTPGSGLFFSFTNGVLSVASSGPILTSVTPNPVTGSSYPVVLELTGSGFTGATEVLLTNASTSTGASYLPTINNDTNLSVNFVPGTAGSSWQAAVINGVSSGAVSFTVMPPAAVSINPANLQDAGPGNVVLSGTGGAAGNSYVVLTTTNLVAPVDWMPVMTNLFDDGGNFSCTNPVDANTPQLFLRIQQ